MERSNQDKILDLLTPTQRQIFALAGDEGLTDGQIARRLERSVWTVRSHLREASGRVGMTRTQIAARVYFEVRAYGKD